MESWRDLFFHLLVWSSAAVALGVVLEGPELVHDVSHMRESPKPEAKNWITVVGLIGWMLVVLGVAGEGIFEVATSLWDDKVKAFDEILIADAQRNAFSAEAGTLDLQIRLAEQKTLAANAEKALETEKLERLKLEAQVAPRRLSIDQQGRIRTACSGLNKGVHVEVDTYGMNSETAPLASQIGHAIFDHSFGVTLAEGIVATGKLNVGVLVNGPKSSEKFMTCLAQALTNIGKLEDVKVNGEMRRGASVMGGNIRMSGKASMQGGSVTIPAGPLPEGSSIQIFVGIKPVVFDVLR